MAPVFARCSPGRCWLVTGGYARRGAGSGSANSTTDRPRGYPVHRAVCSSAATPARVKSYLAGLLAEGWIDAGYSVLVIDREGDHLGLAQRPGVHLVDAAAHLPSPTDLLAIARLAWQVWSWTCPVCPLTRSSITCGGCRRRSARNGRGTARRIG